MLQIMPTPLGEMSTSWAEENMKRYILTIIALVLLLPALSWAQRPAGCATSSIACYPLDGWFYAPGPGKGIDPTAIRTRIPYSKLPADLEAGATGDLTATEIRDLLEGLVGANKLDGAELRNATTSVTVSGNVLTVVQQAADGTTSTRTYNLSSGGTSLPAYLQSQTQALFSRAGSLFWELVNEVPDTPGTDSSIGHVLTVTGTDDRDYAFREGAEQRVLVDVPAGSNTVDKIIEEDGQLYTTIERVVHEATGKQASYESVSFDLGYFSDESALDANFYVVGRYYYNFAKYTPRVVAYISGNSGPKHWVDGDAATLVANITADVGHFGGDTEATPHVNAVGNVYFNEVLRTYRRARTFTAGSGPVTREARLRQANEYDLVSIDRQISQLTVFETAELTPPRHYGERFPRVSCAQAGWED